MSETRKVIDCRKFPAEKPCSIAISGTEEDVLELAKWVLEDSSYVARLKRHYQMVKAAIKKPQRELPWWKRKRMKPRRR